MRRIGRLLLAPLAAFAVLGGSILAALALLGVDPIPWWHGSARAPGAGATGKTELRGEPRWGSRSANAASPRRAAPLLAAGAGASWKALERSLPARVGIAVSPLGHGTAANFGTLRSAPAWSTIKVPILVTAMREPSGNLSSTEEAWAMAALTESDNEAAANLFGEIENARDGLSGASKAVEATLRLTGDTTTVVTTAPPPSGAISTYGQTDWSLPASADFLRSLARGCLLGPDTTEYILGLMEEVVPEQRWGFGSVDFDPAWQIAFKGGWGPEGSSSGAYLVRQSGVLRHNDAGVAVAIGAEAASGSFEAGVEALDQVAAWLHDNLDDLGYPAQPTC